jgi:hypothetical protein
MSAHIVLSKPGATTPHPKFNAETYKSSPAQIPVVWMTYCELLHAGYSAENL